MPLVVPLADMHLEVPDAFAARYVLGEVIHQGGPDGVMTTLVDATTKKAVAVARIVPTPHLEPVLEPAPLRSTGAKAAVDAVTKAIKAHPYVTLGVVVGVASCSAVGYYIARRRRIARAAATCITEALSTEAVIAEAELVVDAELQQAMQDGSPRGHCDDVTSH